MLQENQECPVKLQKIHDLTLPIMQLNSVFPLILHVHLFQTAQTRCNTVLLLKPWSLKPKPR